LSRRRRFLLATLVFGILVALAPLATLAATPATGTVGPSSGTSTSWDFAPVGPGASSSGTVEGACLPVYCDSYDLTLTLPQPDGQFYSGYRANLKIDYTWTSTAPTDLDLFAFAPDGTESGPGSPDDTSTGGGEEVLNIANPSSGTWTIVSHVGVTPAPTAAHAVATLTYSAVTLATPPVPGAHDPNFADASPPVTYESADVLGRADAGEPSLGTDWKTGNALYMAGDQISRITFNDSASPPSASWTDVTPPEQGVVNEDAILFTDHQTNRTVATGLLVVGSDATVSDDDGANWAPATFPEPHGPDHETVGGGPYRQPAPATVGLTGYPNAVYYCSQNIVQAAGAFCGRSDDGGLTYNVSSDVFGATSPCGAIHGHVKVAPDGTVYLPQDSCKRPDGVEGQGMAVSTDNGQTWAYRVIPDSTAKPINSGTDPSVGIGSGGNVYFGYEDGSGHPKVAVSHDRGATWSPSFDAGSAWNIQNSKFSAVVAGDNDRAAFSFLGTASAGNDQSASFGGTWYLYTAFTYDGGSTWQTVNDTPGDPVQRGCIWNGGGTNACRNLLDFNDSQIDARGRVLVAYTDGCKNIDFSYHSITGGVEGLQHGPSQCDTNPNAFADTDKVNFDALARQSCGKGLLAAFDPGFSAACPGPVVTSVNPLDGATGVRTGTGVSATFSEPLSSWSLTLTDSLGNSVKGTVSCTNPCANVLFNPTGRLKKGLTYRATATGSNPNGSTSKTWSFST
jgi:hypothetical protein